MAEPPKLVALETPPAEEILDFLERTVAALRSGEDVPLGVVVAVLYRGTAYSIHTKGTREAGTLAMIGMLEVAKAKLAQHIDEENP